MSKIRSERIEEYFTHRVANASHDLMLTELTAFDTKTLSASDFRELSMLLFKQLMNGPIAVFD